MDKVTAWRGIRSRVELALGGCMISDSGASDLSKGDMALGLWLRAIVRFRRG